MNFKRIIFFFIVTLLFTSKLVFSQNIVINEIMSSNTRTICDEDGNTSDWIELYNCSTSQVDLAGYYLSDDSLEIKKWQFGNAVINPGKCIIVFASDKDTLLNYWHTNDWPVQTNQNSIEKPLQPYELEVDWMSYNPLED